MIPNSVKSWQLDCSPCFRYSQASLYRGGDHCVCVCGRKAEKNRHVMSVCLSPCPLYLLQKKCGFYVCNKPRCTVAFFRFLFFTDLFNQYNNLSERMNYILYYVYLKMLCKIGVLIRFVLFIGFCFLKEVSKAAFI